MRSVRSCGAYTYAATRRILPCVI